MNKFFFIVYLLFCTFAAQAQTYTFECFSNAYMTGDSCTICPNTVYKSQSFNGLMIYRDGVKFRWIDEPYLIRLRPNNLVEFIEQAISTPDKISIPLANTDFATVQGFIDSTFCEGASFDYVFYYNDGVGTVAVNSGDTLTITAAGTDLTYTGTSSPITLNSSTGADVTVTGGTGIGLSATTTNMTVTNTAPDQTVSITGTGITVGGTYPNFTLTAADQSATNENLTISVGANSENLGGQTLNVTGTGIVVPTYTPATNTLNIAATEVDGSTTNEIQTLSVSGTSPATVTLSNTGGSFTLATAGTASMGVSGSTITITGGGGSNWTNTGGNLHNTALGRVAIGVDTTTEARLTVKGTTGTANKSVLRLNGSNGMPNGTRFISAIGGTSGTNSLGFIEGAINSGGGMYSLLTNTSSTVGANNVFILQTNKNSQADPTIRFSTDFGSSGDYFCLGIDNNNSDAFKIEPQATLGGTLGLIIEQGGNVGVNTSDALTSLDLSNNSDGILMQSGNNASRPAIGSVLRRNGNGVLEFSNTASDWGVIIAQTGVSQTVGNGLGTTPTFTTLPGSTILSGRYQFTVGTAPSTDGTAFTIGLPAGVFTHTPSAVVGAGNKQAASDITKFYTTCTTTSVGVFVNGTLTAGATYILNLQVQN